MPKLLKALCDHKTDDPTLLFFRHGDIIEVEINQEAGWWEGSLEGRQGLFPSQFVIPLSLEEEREYLDRLNNLKSADQMINGRRTNGSHINDRKNSTVSFNDEESILPPSITSFPGEDEEMFTLYKSLEGLSLYPTEEWRTTLLHSLYNEIIPREYFEISDTSKSLPRYWGINHVSNFKEYYFNMVTDEVSWDFPSSDLTTRLIPKPLSQTPSSKDSYESDESDASDDSDTLADPLLEMLPRRSRRPSGFVSPMDSGRSGPSWASVNAIIGVSVHRLNHAIKHNLKRDFVYHANCIVRSVQQVLVATGVADVDNSSLNSHLLLKANYTHMLKTLGELTLASREAAKVWPAPNALTNLKACTDDILLSVRHFVNTSQEAGIRIQPYEPYENPEANEEGGDNIQRLGDLVLRITSEVLFLNSATQQDTWNSTKLIQVVRKIINLSGETLSLISTLVYADSPEKLLVAFNNYLQTMYEKTGLLAVKAQDIAEECTLPENITAILEAAATLECSAYRLMIGAKFLREERDVYELSMLRREVERINNSLAETSGSKPLDILLNFKPRRAMSMSFHNFSGLGYTPIRPDRPVGLNGLVSNGNGASDNKPNGTPYERNQRSYSSPAHTIRPVQSAETFPRLMYPNIPPKIEESPQYYPRHSLSHSIISSADSNMEYSEDLVPYSEIASIAPSRARSLRQNERHWFLEPDYADDSIVIVDNVVKGGTVASFVERLTSHDTYDTSFNATFLLTYRSFTTTVEFFDLLFRRFNLQCPPGLQPDEQEMWAEKKLTPVRLRVFNIMKSWLESYYNEDEDTKGLEDLRHFAGTTMKAVMPKAASNIVDLVEKRKDSTGGLRKLVRTEKTAPTPILPRNLNKIKLLDIDPLEMARQLTIINSNLYQKIKPTEFLNNAWSKKNSKPGYVNLTTTLSTKITKWVADSILTAKDIKKRLLVIKYFISVAEHLSQLHNYHSLISIIAGTTVAPVFRLKRMWDMVPPRQMATLTELQQLMDTSRNYAKYRERLHSVDPPCVPFIGMYLTDLTFNDDGNSDYLPSKPHLINFFKQNKTAETIREIQQFQNSPYALDSVAEIQDFFHEALEKAADMSALYDTSLTLEPRERNDEKIARLLHESGFL